jgi:phage terminase large subunit-like protein
MDLLRPLFEANGLDYEIVRNPRAIHSLLAPRIEDAFANKKIIWGKNPLMNWYVGNTAVKIKNDGNKEYIKKDEHRRKTDGFQAFIHAMYRADEIDEMDISSSLDLMDSLVF